MKFIYGRQELAGMEEAQQHCFLSANGLGGYAGLTSANSVNRCDQGVLVAALGGPNHRMTLVHRLREELQIGDRSVFLSTQAFRDGRAPEEGFRYLESFSWDAWAEYRSSVSGVTVTRRLAADWEENRTALCCEIENTTDEPCVLVLRPSFRLAPKETALPAPQVLTFRDRRVSFGDRQVWILTGEEVRRLPLGWEKLSYPEDEKDGRQGWGYACFCCEIRIPVKPRETRQARILFSAENSPAAPEQILQKRLQRKRQLAGMWRDPLAAQLAAAADDFIVRRGEEKTVIAGYPLFADWGRDTMIALPGCCLAGKRYEDARRILRTFLRLERRGLVPNLFPEGDGEPLYNTVDAALLLINTLWDYLQRTGDWEFGREAYPVLVRIVENYRRGTDHHIRMDRDGLIACGAGREQLTWMDVCVDGILPTPRQGKPVEVNAFWYSALRVMEALGEKLGEVTGDYGILADRVKVSFRKAFVRKDGKGLLDLVSGTKADRQLRCNQIFALELPFPVLDRETERAVVDTVGRELYTSCGLRTLSPGDPEFHPSYGGSQLSRDLAYHQGTVWVFPMGAYYLGWLRTRGNTKQAAAEVRRRLETLEPMLREGCAGQLPEIYDGACPSRGKGCYAQAWSTAEMLRVFDKLREIEEEENGKN